MNEVEKYRRRRDKRLVARGIRIDDDDENNGGKRGGDMETLKFRLACVKGKE